jgi:ferric-dicitrate binding protein FerR (iron transport regulator)
MVELEQLGREVREQLGAPSQAFLRAQRHELKRAFSRPVRSAFAARRWFAAAALVSSAVIALLAFRWHGSSPQITATEMVLNAPTGARRVELSDGSALVLAPLSLARVHVGTDSTRCVVEVGTLQFDVAPQKNRQFMVLAGLFEVRVVGTRFRVSRSAAGVVEVLVEHGVVRVRAPGSNAPIELLAGDRLRGDEHELSLLRSSASSPAAPPPSAEATPSAVVPQTNELPSAADPHVPDAPNTSPRTSPAHSDWQALYRAHDYAGALAAAKQAGVDRLLQTLGAQALFELADSARLGGDSELALRVFNNLERRFPASAQGQDAVFLSGRIEAARGQSDAARASFEKYLARNPRGTYSLEATGRLVESYAARGDVRAKAAAQSYLERAPNGPYQRLCRSVLAAP